MPELSFTGLLEAYVRYLSYREGDEKTGRLRTLAREVETERNFRLLEPLVLLAYLTDRMHLLAAEAVPGGVLEPELKLMASFAGKDELLAELARQRWFADDPLRNEYLKVWEFYVCERDQGKYRDGTKALMRERVLPLFLSSGVSTYRLAKDTGLSPSAVRAWLVDGDLGRLSLESADRLVKHFGVLALRPGEAPEPGWRGELDECDRGLLAGLEHGDRERLLRDLFRTRRRARELGCTVDAQDAELAYLRARVRSRDEALRPNRREA